MKVEGKSNSIPKKSSMLDLSRILKRTGFHSLFHWSKNWTVHDRMELLTQKSHRILSEIKTLGFTRSMNELDKGKLSVFNQLNFFQFITGIIVPLLCFFGNSKFPITSFFVASLPAWVSLVVLYLNFYYRYEAGMITYFILYPLVTSVVFMSGLNLGVELYFILNGILAVFFLPQISQMAFSVGLSMISYFVLVVMNKQYGYQLHATNYFLFLFNQFTAILFIFYALFLIKKENTLYEFGILATNQALKEQNEKIEKQKKEIGQKAEELAELNAFKNKLFSVISHDMKTPMYALRNLFRSIQEQKISGEEIKQMLPDVVTDLNYTTGLMENLLHWVKSQMDLAGFHPVALDLDEIVEDCIHVHHLQAHTKKIKIAYEAEASFQVMADKDMITMILRNLISNAIKFTPSPGKITVGIRKEDGACRISVTDTGIGMNSETLAMIRQNAYYSTMGTEQESGTGLGLMLINDFLTRTNTTLQIDSEPGKGSRFSFILPLAS